MVVMVVVGGSGSEIPKILTAKLAELRQIILFSIYVYRSHIWPDRADRVHLKEGLEYETRCLRNSGSIPCTGKTLVFADASRPALGPNQPPIQ